MFGKGKKFNLKGTKVKMENEVKNVVKVREDLNDMVQKISLNQEQTRYGTRSTCTVKLFNNETIAFADNEGLYELLMSYKKSGQTGYLKSIKLVEELKTGKVDVADGGDDDDTTTYICVLYELADGTKYRLFPSRRYVARKIIDNYYNLFKKQKQQNKKV